MSETAKIIIGENTYELPVITGSENEKAIDISKLRAMTGYVTLDKGFKNTGSTTSAITFLNGEKGILRYTRSRIPLWLQTLVLISKWPSLMFSQFEILLGTWTE